MKKILCLFAAVAATILLGLSLSAQEKAPYVTSLGGENWFISIGGGVNACYDNNIFLIKPGIGVDANIGKWFTPVIGLRAGYHGFTNYAADPSGWFTDVNKFGYHFGHVDVLYNLSAAIGGYNERRFWEFIPYVQGGLVVGTGNGTVSTMGLGGGIMNALRLGEKVDLTLEIGAVISPESAFRHGHERFVIFPSASLGLSFNLGKSDFQAYRPAPIVDLPDYTGMIAALKDELATTIMKLGSANETIDNLKKKLAAYNLTDGKTYLYKNGAFTEAAPKNAEAQPEIFYFDISKTTLSERELARLEFYAKNTFKKDQQLLITGGADAGTGSAAVNERLSRQRAEYVKNLLVNTYGFNPANLETNAEVLGTDSPIKGRIVTIRVK